MCLPSLWSFRPAEAASTLHPGAARPAAWDLETLEEVEQVLGLLQALVPPQLDTGGQVQKQALSLILHDLSVGVGRAAALLHFCLPNPKPISQLPTKLRNRKGKEFWEM